MTQVEHSGIDPQPPQCTGAPERIWLVVGDIEQDCTFGELTEVTWCTQAQYDADVAYIRADKVLSLTMDLQLQLDAARRELATCANLAGSLMKPASGLETSALCPHGLPLAENVCGPCSEGRPNTLGTCLEHGPFRTKGAGCPKCPAKETTVRHSNLVSDPGACGSMNERGHACDLPTGHGGMHDWEQDYVAL